MCSVKRCHQFPKQRTLVGGILQQNAASGSIICFYSADHVTLYPYSYYQKCWHLTLGRRYAAGHVLALTISDFELEYHRDCDYDWLSIYCAGTILNFGGTFTNMKRVPWVNGSGSESEPAGSRIQFFGSVTALIQSYEPCVDHEASLFWPTSQRSMIV